MIYYYRAIGNKWLKMDRPPRDGRYISEAEYQQRMDIMRQYKRRQARLMRRNAREALRAIRGITDG